jgi:formylglycine-generating enzyme required for sulfatase activity
MKLRVYSSFTLLITLAALCPAQQTNSSRPTPKLAAEARRKIDVLMLIADEAEKTVAAAERHRLLQELFDKSDAVVREQTNSVTAWLLRALAAVELDRPHVGWEAGAHLKALGAADSEDSKIRRVMASLERKGWLGDTDPEIALRRRTEAERLKREAETKARQEDKEPRITFTEKNPMNTLPPDFTRRWTNSIGMVFVPVGELLFSIWETRVQDFEAFAKDTSYSDAFVTREGRNWRSPGFQQGPTHPVCDITWGNAKAFCTWLTDVEHTLGLLSTNVEYRLPKDGEWSQACGNGKFPWGHEWPPPSGVGNLPDESFHRVTGLDRYIHGYRDGFARTAPVGSFAPNPLGIFDLAGNVREWCEDPYSKQMNNAEVRQQMLKCLHSDPNWKHSVSTVMARYDTDSGKNLIRGSGWLRDPMGGMRMLTALRTPLDQTSAFEDLGFRVVLVRR